MPPRAQRCGPNEWTQRHPIGIPMESIMAATVPRHGTPVTAHARLRQQNMAAFLPSPVPFASSVSTQPTAQSSGTMISKALMAAHRLPHTTTVPRRASMMTFSSSTSTLPPTTKLCSRSTPATAAMPGVPKTRIRRTPRQSSQLSREFGRLFLPPLPASCRSSAIRVIFCGSSLTRFSPYQSRWDPRPCSTPISSIVRLPTAGVPRLHRLYLPTSRGMLLSSITGMRSPISLFTTTAAFG